MGNASRSVAIEKASIRSWFFSIRRLQHHARAKRGATDRTDQASPLLRFSVLFDLRSLRNLYSLPKRNSPNRFRATRNGLGGRAESSIGASGGDARRPRDISSVSAASYRSLGAAADNRGRHCRRDATCTCPTAVAPRHRHRRKADLRIACAARPFAPPVPPAAAAANARDQLVGRQIHLLAAVKAIMRH